MTEEAASQTPIPLEDAKRYLAAKLPQMVCNGCGEDKFGVVGEDDGSAQPVYVMQGVSRGMKSVCFLCNNCGMIYLVGWPFMTSWLGENPVNA